MVLNRRDAIIKIELAYLFSECRIIKRSIILSCLTYLKKIFVGGLVLFMIATCYNEGRSMSPLKVFVQPIF